MTSSANARLAIDSSYQRGGDPTGAATLHDLHAKLSLGNTSNLAKPQLLVEHAPNTREGCDSSIQIDAHGMARQGCNHILPAAAIDTPRAPTVSPRRLASGTANPRSPISNWLSTAL